MLLFLFIILTILMIIAIILSEIRFNIVKYEYSSNSNEQNQKSDKIRNQAKLEFYLLGKIKFLNLNLNNKKISTKLNKTLIENKLNQIKGNIDNLTKDEKKRRRENIKTSIKGLIKKLKIEKLGIKILLDTEDPTLTSCLIGGLYITIPNIIKHNFVNFSEENYSLDITPLYKFTNYFYISLNCIFSIKIVHIINMLIENLYRKGQKRKYERSPNRRTNANCNGKHKKYDRCKHNNRRTYGNIR